LGKVTEIGLFTEKIEVKKTDMSDAEIDKKLQDKLDKLLNVIDVDAAPGETKPDITDVEVSERALTSMQDADPVDDES